MARDFNASNDAITVTSSSSIQDTFSGGGTAIVWLNPRNDGFSNTGRVYFKDNGHNLFTRDESGTSMKINFAKEFDTATGNWRTTNTDVDEDVWNSLVIVYDDGDINNDPTFYLNESTLTVGSGLDEVTTPSGSVKSDTGQDLIIGNRDLLDRSTDGLVSHFILINSELTQTQALAINRGVNPFVFSNPNHKINLPLYGNDDPEPDLTGNNNTGSDSGTTKATTNPPVELLENYI